MKNVVSTLTILILILGIGLVMPKLIPTGAIAASRSQQNNPSDDPEALTNVNKEEKTKADASEVIEPENKTSEPGLTENEDSTAENFPIKTAVEDIDVSGNNTENASDSTSIVDIKETNNDREEAKPKDVPAKTAVNSSETNKEPVAKPVQAAPPLPAEEITYTNVTYTRWVSTPLNMRKGPGKDYGLITSIPMAQTVTVTSIASNGWAKVLFGNKEGYVSSKYLSETEVQKPVAVSPPAPIPAEPKPAQPAPAPAPKPQTPSYEAYKMYVGGKTISYKNGGIAEGQRIIDSNSKLISTWGGAETFSGNDGYNTHFIGHNPGIFSVLTQLGNGSTIIVTDSNGQPTTYKVTRIFTVDDNAHNAKDGENYYNYMVSKRGGEVITLQTCLGPNKNLIIRAEK